jgi:hypothetical protein
MVTVTTMLGTGAPGIVEAGTWTMITWGGAVIGAAVGTTDEASTASVDRTTELGGRVVDGSEVLVESFELRPERLINDAVMVAPPMIKAAMIGPSLVRLHQLADRAGVTTWTVLDGSVGALLESSGDIRSACHSATRWQTRSNY